MTYDPNRPLNPTATERELDKAADKAGNAVSKTADKAGNALDNATDKAKDVVNNLTNKANDALNNVPGGADLKDKATQVAGDVKDKATQVAGQAYDQADAATTTVGSKIQDAAQALRQNAPSEGTVGQAAAATADTLEKAGSYLQQQDLAGMRGDLEALIRKHPTESLLIAFGVGFLLARTTRR